MTQQELIKRVFKTTKAKSLRVLNYGSKSGLLIYFCPINGTLRWLNSTESTIFYNEEEV